MIGAANLLKATLDDLNSVIGSGKDFSPDYNVVIEIKRLEKDRLVQIMVDVVAKANASADPSPLIREVFTFHEDWFLNQGTDAAIDVACAKIMIGMAGAMIDQCYSRSLKLNTLAYSSNKFQA